MGAHSTSRECVGTSAVNVDIPVRRKTRKLYLKITIPLADKTLKITRISRCGRDRVLEFQSYDWSG
jgi:hypothetical protein